MPTLQRALELELLAIEGSAPSATDRARIQANLARYPPRTWSPALRRAARRVGLRPPGIEGLVGSATFAMVSSQTHTATLVDLWVEVIEAPVDHLPPVDPSLVEHIQRALDIARSHLPQPLHFAVHWPPDTVARGPSLVLAVCLGALSAAHGEPLDPACCATGDARMDGSVVSVGHIESKAQAAETAGCWLLAPTLPTPASVTILSVDSVTAAWALARSSTSRRKIEARARAHASRARAALLARAHPLVPRARDLAMAESSCHGLVGGPGAGKSTLLATLVDPAGTATALWIAARDLGTGPADEALGHYLGDHLGEPGLSARGLAACLADPAHPLGQLCADTELVLFVDGVDEVLSDPAALVAALEDLANTDHGLTVCWSGRPQVLPAESTSALVRLRGLTLLDLAPTPHIRDLPRGLLARLGDPSLLGAWRRYTSPVQDTPPPDLATLLDQLASTASARGDRSLRALDRLAELCLAGSSSKVSEQVLAAIGAQVLRAEGARVHPKAARRLAMELLVEHLQPLPHATYQVLPTWPLRAALYRALRSALDLGHPPSLQHIEASLSVPACLAALESLAREQASPLLDHLGWCSAQRDSDWLAAWMLAVAHAEVPSPILERAVSDWSRQVPDAPLQLAEALHLALFDRELAWELPDSDPSPSDSPTHILAGPLLGQVLAAAAEALQDTHPPEAMTALWQSWTAGCAAGYLPLPPLTPLFPTEGDPADILRAAWRLRLLDEWDGDPTELLDGEDIEPLLSLGEDLGALGREWGALELLAGGHFAVEVLDWLFQRLLWLRFLADYGLAAPTWLAPHHPDHAASILASAIADLVGAADMAMTAAKSAPDHAELATLTEELVASVQALPTTIEQAHQLGVPRDEPDEALADALWNAEHAEELAPRDGPRD